MDALIMVEIVACILATNQHHHSSGPNRDDCSSVRVIMHVYLKLKNRFEQKQKAKVDNNSSSK